MTTKTQWEDSDIEYLQENYFFKTYQEISQVLDMSVSVIHRKAKELGLPRKTQFNRIEHEYGMPMIKLLRLYHYDKEMSINEMAQEFGVARTDITRWMTRFGLQWRNRSEAERLKWSRMTLEQRKNQTKKAHEKTRELIDNDEHNFQELWRNDPKKAQAHVERIAPLGSVERERRGANWMSGRTGPLHPSWRGGKDEYHRLRSLASGNWWVEREKALKRDDYTCQNCGVVKSATIIIEKARKTPVL